jgi:hypothetical protein
MREEKVRVYIKVVPQFTIRPGTVSLIAEESVHPFKKGSVVIQVQRDLVYRMDKPLRCEIVSKHKTKGYTAKPVMDPLK